MSAPVRLLLLRHGEAERQAARDELRRLTPHGRAEAAAVAECMRGLGLQPSACFSSPYVRARETAEIVAGALGAGAVRSLARVTPDDDPRRSLASLDAVAGTGELPLVVTHMPFIGALIGLLVDGSVGGTRGVATASGVLLVGDVFAPGLLRIEQLLSP